MKKRRALTLVVALCLLVSLLTPGVAATNAGENAYQPTAEATEQSSATERNSLIVSKEDQPEGVVKTLWDETEPAGAEEETSTASGHWVAEESTVGQNLDLMNAQLPTGVQELKEAAKLYDEDEVVAAFIVLDGEPLSEQGFESMAAVPASKDTAMRGTQNVLIRRIESTVLGGEKLDVRYQFTYLTNSISVRTAFGNLEKIAQVEGVKTVFLMPVYNTCTTEAQPSTANSGETVGAPTVWEELGYTGTGMKIAVIDTGLDLDHPSFAADPATNDSSMTKDDVSAVVSKLNASKLMGGLNADKLYRSTKVPYAFNYVDRSLTASHDMDAAGDHGTHVAGIAAANDVEGSNVVGMAPDAQIIVMKVFGANGGAYTDDIVAALEDAMTLDCDVVNLSLGSPAGFSSEDPEIDAIYSRIAYHDMIVSIAAGNEGTSSFDNLWGTNLNTTDHPDTSTVASPATYVNATTVASADNSKMVTSYFTVGEDRIAYSDASGLYETFDSLGFDTKEYVMVGGVGTEEDFAAVDVEGKIAVVSRGSINFSLKLYNAEQAGAIGLVVYNNTAGSIGMQMTDDNGNLQDGISGMVPAVSISQKDGERLANAAEKTLTIAEKADLVEDENGGQISSFSSWGVSPDLHLLPDITAIGGNVYSTLDGGEYGNMSGTSMAAPQMAGVSALVLQYLHETYPTMPDAQIRVMADSLLMSTATPIISNETQVEASPRQQGAGLVSALNAITAESYLSVPGSSKPKAELGDDVERSGEFAFTFDVHNFGQTEKTYTLSASLLTEDYVTYGDQEFMAQVDRALSGTVSFDADTITVAPGGAVRVNATITLSVEDKLWLDEHFANGNYVEGYVYLQDEDGVDLSLPFLGFYGDWTSAPTLDTAFWTDDMFWKDEAELTGNEYFHVMWTSLGGTDWVLGYNPYTGDPDDYTPEHNVISNNGDGVIDSLTEIYLSLMRNARTVTFTYTDTVTGEIYSRQTLDYLTKTMYISSYGQVVPSLYSWYSDEFYNFTDADGKPLANGTKLELTVSTTSDYSVHKQDLTGDSFTIPITVDTQAPSLNAVESSADAEGNYITLNITENVDVASVYVLNATGTRILAQYGPEYLEKTDDGYTATLDITGMGSRLSVILCDYGANESSYTLTYTQDDNLPDAPGSGLYAYRVADANIGNDTLYGWVSIDPETAEVTALTSEYMEGYALTAAEYAGGYLFGVEAATYNLVVMTPGLWTRTVIGNLGVSALDMTFDRDNQIMYVLTKDGSTISLCTLDLVTAELTTVHTYTSSAPWAITAAKGQLYAIRQGSAYLYQVNSETYELEELVKVEGDSMIYPYYSQSMTYSAQDNCLYWTYFSYMYGDSALYCFDLDDLTSYIRTNFGSYAEFVGLVTMEDDLVDYTHCDGQEDCPTAHLTDVERDQYYHAGADYVVANNYMVGVTNTTFGPYTTVNRAMVTAIMYRMAGRPEVTGTCQFTDVEPGSYYENAVIWAAENGIVYGVSETTFAPETPVTREQLVALLYRFTRFQGYNVTDRYDSLAAFVDVDQVSAYAVPAFKWAIGTGIIFGMDDTHIGAKGSATRAQFAAMLLRLYNKVTGGYHIPTAELSGLVLDAEDVLLRVGNSQDLTVRANPWTAQLGELTWTSSDETVAAVRDGLVEALAPGYVDITVTCGDLSVICKVHVVDPKGTVYAYNLYDSTDATGSWISFEQEQMPGYQKLGESPATFVAADYNGYDGKVYGYDDNYKFHTYDPETGKEVKSDADAGSYQVLDMAFDYSTGYMFASVSDTSTYTYGIYHVDMISGQIELVGESEVPYISLACSTDGQLYGLSAECVLEAIEDNGDGTVTGTEIADLGLGSLYYAQSMCYDHNSDALVWGACMDTSGILWIDPVSGQYLVLGSPTGSNMFEYTGLYTVPETLPEKPEVAAQSMTAPETLTMMCGSSKTLPVSITPLNVSDRTVAWTVSDSTVATVDEGGVITALKPGSVTVTGTKALAEGTATVTIEVTVIESGDNLFGFVLTDLATYGGDVWVEIHDSDPANPEYLAASSLTLWSAEYYNGKLYAYGYDSNDWEAPVLFLTINPETFEIESSVEVPDCPTVYDMTYDYASSTMYAVAGYGQGESDLYMVNLKTGKLILIAEMDPFFMSIAASADGTIYAMAGSVEEIDWENWTSTFTDAVLCTVDPANGTYAEVGSTGMKSNLMASMTFDYDTGNLYWTNLFRADYFSPVTGGLCVVDPATGETVNLGVIGAAGSQVVGLFALADAYPEEAEQVLTSVTIDADSNLMGVGGELQLTAMVVPSQIEPTLTWTSSDETVATVDENGKVTGQGKGSAVITVTAQSGDVTVCGTYTVHVFTESDSFLSYSPSMGGWVTVSRLDPTKTQLVAEADLDVRAAAYVGDALYFYDSQNNLYAAQDTDGVPGTPALVGTSSVEMNFGPEIYFEIRGLAYDAANEQMLALGCFYGADEGYTYEIQDGCRIYTVDLTTGALTELCILTDMSQVRGITCTDEGTVYVYSSYDDYFSRVDDLSAGTYTKLVTSQSLGLYGNYENMHPLCYDSTTGLIYWVFNSNGNFYKLLTVNTRTNAIRDLGYIGTVANYRGDSFTTLLIKN